MWYLGNLANLPFADSTLDVCVCANTLQHLRPNGPQQKAVAELTRVVRNNGVIIVSVHHFSAAKQKAGWIKEGKPGQAEIDYIFRFSRAELLALLPGASISAVGFDFLNKIPKLGSQLQMPLQRSFGTLLARLGYGHMLVAVLKVKKLSN